jgi:hypothetical protein
MIAMTLTLLRNSPMTAERYEAEMLAKAAANPADFEMIHPAKQECRANGHEWWGEQLRIDRPTGVVTVERTCVHCLETQEQVVDVLGVEDSDLA